MGFIDGLLGIIGFGIGIQIGLILGFLFFIYFDQKRDANKDPVTKSLRRLDPSSIVDFIHELPLWVLNPDYERVDWINKFIQDTWPYFDKPASEIIKASLEATFAEYIGKYKIKSIYFKRCTLGTFPPKIHGVKQQESRENELVIDLVFKWAGNSDVVVGIEILSLKLDIQIVDIQISAATRVVMKPFVPTFPCFSCLAVSLMEKPNIDFGLRVFGGDVMSIPGFYHVMQEVVARQVANLYLWPQSCEIDILDDSIGATKRPVGILHVKVVRARKLLDMDFLSTSDPYVKLSLTGERLPAKKTTVKMNNLNPEWNEDFKLIVKEPHSQVLQLQLFDWEKVGAHDYLGMQVVPLNQLNPYEKEEFSLDLVNSTDPNDRHNKKQRGQITVEITFVPFVEDSKKFSGSSNYTGTGGSSPTEPEPSSFCRSGLLQVTIIAAEDVEGKNHNNPYAVVLFGGDRRKTKTIKRTRDPFWNEEFQFVLDEPPVKDHIHIKVMSKKRRMGFMSKDSLGFVDLNLGDVVYNGHINEKFHLINSRHGIIHLDLRWKVT